ncbi:DUF3703 domain-containing protein [Salinimicrobium sp. CDJ15-81-2]|nr:DUF3703 domain-containing protein [Salinimicrobium nanhaiense]
MQQTFHHLERAHTIDQSYPFEHSFAHWLMLKFSFTIKNTKELLGRLPRLLEGGVKSFVGEIPLGNTGGANEPPLRSMPLLKDIEKLFSAESPLSKIAF